MNRRPYSPEKKIEDNDDKLCVPDELANIGQNDNNSNMGIGRLYTTEVPDEEDNTTLLGDESNNATKETEIVDTRHTDLLSMVNDIAHSEKLCEETGRIKFEPGMEIWLEDKQFKPHHTKKLQQKYIASYYTSGKTGESTYMLRPCKKN